MNIPYTFPYVVTDVLSSLGNVHWLPADLAFIGAGILFAVQWPRLELSKRWLLVVPALWLVGEVLMLLNNTVLINMELFMWRDVFRWTLLFSVGEAAGLYIRRLKNEA